MYAFAELAAAAYRPRPLSSPCGGEAREPPPAVRERRELAFHYPALRRSDAFVAAAPVAVSTTQLRINLGTAAARFDCWEALANPPSRDVLLTGRKARGVADKVLETPLAPSLIAAGRPTDCGVWRAQSVRAVGAARALAWERKQPVERAFIEYPAHGIVTAVDLTARLTARYRSTIRIVEAMDGPPARLGQPPQCGATDCCEACCIRT